MSSLTRQAISVARDTDATVHFSNGKEKVSIIFTASVPLAADDLVSDGWYISPSSARKSELKIYKSK